jgi:hypothetical protein
MTDVTSIGLRPPRRGLPLGLEHNVFELIAAGHDELRHSKDGKPNLARIARAAGLHRQRFADIGSDNGAEYPSIFTLGAVVRCYERIHGVTEKEALAAVLRVIDIDDAEPVAA